jgi:hypothetical protein
MKARILVLCAGDRIIVGVSRRAINRRFASFFTL